MKELVDLSPTRLRETMAWRAEITEDTKAEPTITLCTPCPWWLNLIGNHMKIIVIGGSGLIGKKVVNNLREKGHEVVAASPSSGVNTLTGEGLAEALARGCARHSWAKPKGRTR